jgi:hypothetical protein
MLNGSHGEPNSAVGVVAMMRGGRSGLLTPAAVTDLDLPSKRPKWLLCSPCFLTYWLPGSFPEGKAARD